MTLLKHFFINKPAFYLNDKWYVRYLIFIGKICNNFRFNITKFENHKSKSIGIPLFKIRIRQEFVLTTAAYRCSRFLKGFERAGERMWFRYRALDLIGDCPVGTVLDIGANIGEFSYYAFKKVTRNVHAFEPEPNTFTCLMFNLKYTKIKTYNYALADRTGMLPFYLVPKSADSSLINSSNTSASMEIQAFKLDDVIETLPIEGKVLLKMDAEGAEPEVLMGAAETLKRIDFAVIDAGAERMDKSTDNDVKKILLDSGFEVQVFEDGIVHAWRENCRKNEKLRH